MTERTYPVRMRHLGRLFRSTLLLLVLLPSLVAAQRVDPILFDTTACGETSCVDLRLGSESPGESVTAIVFVLGEQFSQSPPLSLPAAIPDDDSLTIPFCFTPDRAGSFADSIGLVLTDTTATPKLDTLWIPVSGVATGADLVIEPENLFFGDVDTGSVARRELLLFNRGTDTIRVPIGDFSGLASPFVLADSSLFPLVLGPGDSILVPVDFAPTAQGAFGAVTAIAVGCSRETEVSFSGRSTELLEKGFGRVSCGSIVCDTLWLSGRGPNDRLTSLRMRDSTDFILPDDLVLPAILPVGDSIGILVCFAPTRRGNIIDSLYVTIDRGAGQERRAVRLSGTGIGPNVEIFPLVLNFPRITPPATANLTATFRNTGEEAIVLTPTELDVPPPFRVVTPLPIRLEPGDSIEVEFEFAPTSRGIFSVPIDIPVGCTRVLQLGLNGSTDFIGTGGVLRVTKAKFSPANDERVSCDVSECTDVTLSNVGNATLVIENLDWLDGTPGFTMTPKPPTPLTIAANESRVVRVCIDARRAGRLEDTLVIASNDRRSIAFGLVLDESLSMDTALDCGGANPPSRRDEAKRQAEIFIDNTLLYLPALGIQDEVAVNLYSGTPRPPFRAVVERVYPLTQVTDPVRTAAKGSLGTPIQRGGTWTGEALRDMIQVLSASPLQDRVIVLLTDGVASGGDLSGNPLQTIINEANAAGVRVFTIGLGVPNGGEADDYVRELAERTNALRFLANDCGSLGEAFARITELVSEGGIWREPFRITVSAPQLIAESVRFDTTYIDDDTCRVLTLTNVGEGEAIITDIQFADAVGAPTTEFYLDGGATSFPIRISENGQRQVRICFRPEGLRERSGQVRAIYNDCFAVDATGEVFGTGYAIANLRLDDERVTLPGNSVTLPIYGDTALARYEVSTITWQLRWNRTMLELQGVNPGAAANGATVVTTGPVIEQGNFATVELTATGPALVTPGELALLDFEFLRGDTLAAIIEITGGQMEDGNPQLLLKNAGIVIHDSICFRELRPISYRTPATTKITVGTPTPTPTSGSEAIELPIESVEEIYFSVELFSVDGRAVRPEERYGAYPGTSRLRLEVGDLEAGTYYLRITDETGSVAFRTVVIDR